MHETKQLSPCHRIGRCLLAFLALLALAGCSTSYIYERADRFAGRWLNGYVELEPAQQAALEAELDALHEWHRREHLPRYSAWLRSLAGELAAPGELGPAELRARGEELGEFWRELADRAVPPLLELGAGMEDPQVEEFLARLREKHAEELEESAERTPEEHAARRARSMERFLKRWTGSLSAAQQAEVRAWSRQLEPSREAWLESRLGWIDAMERALGNRRDEEALEIAAQRLIVRPEDRWTPTYAALVERNSVRTTEFLAHFLAELESGQRARAVGRLEELAAEFEALAADDG